MNIANLIGAALRRPGGEHPHELPHCDLIDTVARRKIQPTIPPQQQTIHLAGDYARPGTGLEPNLNVTRKLPGSW